MRDHEAIIVVLAIALAGCPLTASTTATTTVSSRPIAASSAPVAAAADAPPAGEHGITGAIVRRQLETLHGLTPDQARAQLKKLGHDGTVSVSEVTDSGGGHTYLKDCGENKVCYTSGESGIGLHDDLTLFINPTLKIAPPP